LGETEAARGEAVDVWGGDAFCTVAADVAVAEVVGDDDDDVGRGGGRGECGDGAEREQRAHELTMRSVEGPRKAAS